MKVLLLTAATGGGHVKAAEALVECLSRKHPEWESVTADSLKCISPLVDRLVVGAYLGTVKNTPGQYGMLYDLSERDRGITDLTMTFNKLLSYRLISFIDSCRPSVIVCTHTFPLQMLSSLKCRHKVNIPVIGIVTDFVSHLFWKLDGIDALVVSHRHIKEDMMKIGIPGKIIHTCGIPVSAAFHEKLGRRQILDELGLEEKPTLLVMGGSLGMGQVKSIFASLLKCRRDLQLIAVTGWNEKLKSQLEELSQNTSKNIRIIGYTNQINKLMDISDMIITKPGGVTISEALVKKLPILLIPPIPGQEERNARFLEGKGAAVRLPICEDTENFLCRLLDNPLKLNHMKEMAGKLARPDAGGDILKLVEKLASVEELAEKDGQRLILAEGY
jgi:processive 1,2-diacylglycerol beta-glucosyltransferase